MFQYDNPMGIIDVHKILNLIRETGVILDSKLQNIANKKDKST